MQAQENVKNIERLTAHIGELTDQQSTEVGYGPVCAKHYGLKWGKKHAR